LARFRSFFRIFPVVALAAALLALTAAGAAAETGEAPAPKPPLVPHALTGYKMSPTANDCLTCHGPATAAKAATKAASDAHFVHRDGARIDKLLATRVYCNQCHLPAPDAKPLATTGDRP